MEMTKNFLPSVSSRCQTQKPDSGDVDRIFLPIVIPRTPTEIEYAQQNGAPPSDLLTLKYQGTQDSDRQFTWTGSAGHLSQMAAFIAQTANGLPPESLTNRRMVLTLPTGQEYTWPPGIASTEIPAIKPVLPKPSNHENLFALLVDIPVKHLEGATSRFFNAIESLLKPAPAETAEAAST
ncbi:MAG: hypothetical protein IPK79_12150 [Vampirovibrionales bacterium]|nr:hypothetical protein [Vampirovibrionales bacterium]